jgi:TonB-dependent starch-binding outer membrane protein SusC
MRKNLTLQMKAGRKRYYIVLLFLAVLPVFFEPVRALSNEEVLQDGNEVTGTVVEASTGEPLPGVSILIKGTAQGTITDQDGNFAIIAAPTDVLVFTFMGFLDEEIPVGTNTVINVSLVEDIIGLDEVVVTGYGIQRKSDLTGAIASVNGDDLAEMAVISADQALQGHAAGVNITPSTGLPGGQVNIAVRGISSINGTQPLVIVDGVRSTLTNLNPSDIENVEILKDAASTAIYGSEGGNGVILVTTKAGEAGKPVTSFNFYTGIQKPWKKLNMMNTEQYTELQDILAVMDGDELWSAQFEDPLQNYDYQDLMSRSGVMQNYDLSISGGNEGSNYYLGTDYTKQEGVLKKTDYERFSVRINSEHKLNKIIKLGENVSYTFARRSGFQEWMFQNAYNSPYTDVLTMVPYLPPYTTRYDDTYPSLSGEEFPLSASGVFPIFVDPSDPNMDKKWSVNRYTVNPQVTIDNRDFVSRDHNIGGKFFADLNLFKGFTYTSVVSGYTRFQSSEEYQREYYYDVVNQLDENRLIKTETDEYGWEIQNYFNYNIDLNQIHHFGLMAGTEARYKKWNRIEMERDALINDTPEMRYLSTGTNLENASQFPEGRAYEDAGYAYFGRLTYDYNSKYLVNFSLRKDFSSRFGPDHRSGVFPSASVGWKFSEEEFVKNIGILSFGKIRLGYGESGANAPGYYSYYARVNANGSLLTYPITSDDVPEQGAALSQLPNYDMHWETVVMTNAGIDLAFLENKLTLTVDYFQKKSSEMLMYQDLPATSGIWQDANQSEHQARMGGDARPLVNIGSVKNTGIEFTIGFREREGELKTSFQFNGTFQKNKVLELATDSISRGTVSVGISNVCLTAEGLPMAQFYGYKTAGLFSEEDSRVDSLGDVYIWNQPFVIDETSGDTTWAQPNARPGDFRFVDINNDGVINSDDRTVIGNPIPKFIMGFSAGFEYKNFDLNLFFEGKFGRDLFYGSKLALMEQEGGANRLTDVLDQYRDAIYDNEGNLLFPENHNTDQPRLDPIGYNSNFRVSDYYVESGSYLRLKNIQFGYTIPSNITNRAGISKLRIYVAARNLLTFTKYSGLDPEFDYSPSADNVYYTGRRDLTIQGLDIVCNYPASIMYMMGVNLQF